MNRTAIAAVLAVALSYGASAQQAGENINVLPVVPGNSLKGDRLLQRQLEPSIVVSTRNPNHLAAFYIDYRTVDIAGDVNVGAEGPQLSAGLVATIKGWFAKAFGRQVPGRDTPVAAAPGEANIGYSRSRDGGLTWSGSLLPGLNLKLMTDDPNFPDPYPSPIKSYSATTDPVAVAGPCGVIYVGFIAFNRNSTSAFVIAKFIDKDDSTGNEHTIRSTGEFSVIETGNNATYGFFNDKPDLKIDLGSSGCAHRLYASYTVFNGLDKLGKFQSKVKIATMAFATEDSPFQAGWTKGEISGSYTQNQGTSIAVDPLNGDVYTVWRHFNKPHAIIFAKADKLAAAAGRFGKPLPLFTDLMAPFDQPPVDISFGPDNIAFRMNGFPTAAVAVDSANKSHVYAAWQERVDPLSGTPSPNGSPRIVMARSDNGGGLWSVRVPVDSNARSAEPGGLGYAQPGYGASLPQVMPALSAGSQLLLVYFEARPRAGDSLPGLGAQGFITGYNRILDLRGVVLDKATGAALESFQVSRYPIKPWAASPATSNAIDDLEPVNPPCSPDFGPGLPPCQSRINRIVPHTKSGTLPFIGDYTGLTQLSFVPDGNGAWKWATQPTDVPWAGGHVAFNDARNLVPPPPQDGTEWAMYQTFPSGCVSPGSRNSDVMSSRLSLGLLVTAPLTWRPAPAEFPFTVWNNTNATRFFRLSIDPPLPNVGFGKAGTAFENVSTGDVEVSPFSSSSQVIYVGGASGSTPKVVVTVTEVDTYNGAVVVGGLTGRISFNAETNHPPLVTAGTTKKIEVSNPFPSNPFPSNPFPSNPFPSNPFPSNPFPSNPFPSNPFPSNPFPSNASIEDVSWTVTAPTSLSADTVAAYLANIGIDQATWPYYSFQLTISKASTAGVGGCSGATNLPRGTVVATYGNPFPSNPFPSNPFPSNPFPSNPFPSNSFVNNSSFTVAPSESNAATGPAEAPPAVNQYIVTVRAVPRPCPTTSACAVPAFATFNPAKNAPAAVVSEKNCVPGTPLCLTAESPAPELFIVTDLSTTPASNLGPVDPSVVPAGRPIVLSGAPAVLNGIPGNRSAFDRVHRYYLAPSSCQLSPWNSPNIPGSDSPPSCLIPLVGADQSSVAELVAGARDILPVSVTIPPATSPGAYRLLVYADYLRQVSEKNEYNNWAVSLPFEVIRPRYAGIIGPFAPCSTATTPNCTKSSGSSVPLAWQFTNDGVTAVDSGATQPVLQIDGPNGLHLTASPDLSPGTSEWRYDNVSFTWQYNWQLKFPGTATPLPAGAYLVKIEVPATNQITPTAQSPGGSGPVATITVKVQ